MPSTLFVLAARYSNSLCTQRCISQLTFSSKYFSLWVVTWFPTFMYGQEYHQQNCLHGSSSAVTSASFCWMWRWHKKLLNQIAFFEIGISFWCWGSSLYFVLIGCGGFARKPCLCQSLGNIYTADLWQIYLLLLASVLRRPKFCFIQNPEIQTRI